MKQGYFVELIELGIWQSVFPEPEAEKSQIHKSIEDAIYYIREQSGQVQITVLPD